MTNKFIYLIFCLSLFACGNKEVSLNTLPISDPPAWTTSAIWYQIFPERFCNGDASNDPTLVTMKGALRDEISADWKITPWGHEWYQQEDWAKSMGKDFYTTIQMRRYGGDLKGILSKIPYLKSLGINAVYLNPINDAPSLHKYDARSYHHVDVTFGRSIEKDMAIIETEDAGDPKTWKYTSADSMFIELIEKLHKEGIKIVLDYSWNHTGTQFWAFQDIIKNQEKSRYKDWYEIKSFDDPSTPQNEFDYDGWIGIKSLPELKKIKESPKLAGHPFEGNMPDAVKDHIFAVSKRWMDPNGDGNTADGIDGMRLDVAEHVPLGFWRDFRKFVRSVNPEFYLVGENWWTSWPDTLMDAEPWMRGDVFDAVMHYQWYKPTRYLFIEGPHKSTVDQYEFSIDSLYGKYRKVSIGALMNLGASHDSPRMLTSLANTNKYKHQANPRDDHDYICWQPDSLSYLRMKALTLQQFTFISPPHIYNGDELGMYGADDPDNRKPMWWETENFENEHYNVLSKDFVCTPKADKTLWNHYHDLCQLRKENITLQNGSYHFIHLPNAPNILCYDRDWKGSVIRVMINPTSQSMHFDTAEVPKSSLFVANDVDIEENRVNFGPYGGIVFQVKP